jgi:hypothetical protein
VPDQARGCEISSMMVCRVLVELDETLTRFAGGGLGGHEYS